MLYFIFWESRTSILGKRCLLLLVSRPGWRCRGHVAVDYPETSTCVQSYLTWDILILDPSTRDPTTYGGIPNSNCV